jgi:hypothetical protein
LGLWWIDICWIDLAVWDAVWDVDEEAETETDEEAEDEENVVEPLDGEVASIIVAVRVPSNGR